MMEREYIVTAKTKEDLQSLYDDLETLGGCKCIPSREVECAHRRPISRNTHYYLTNEEAALIRNDERVMNVELSFRERGIEFTPSYIIEAEATEEQITIGENDPNYTLTTNTWSKSINNSDAHRAWAMYRCVNGATVSNWGNNGNQSISGTVLFTSTGKNVDVVVVDGCFDPAHPEFAVNENGTGGSRVNQFNWFSLNPEVTSGAADTYSYRGTPRTYNVINNGASSYTFSGDATGDDPTLNIREGDLITFNVESPGHPFWIKTSNVTGTGSAVTSGITNNGTQSGTIVWNTAGLATGTYYYICQFHSAMVGTINVTASSYINGSSNQQSDNNHGCHVAGTLAGNRRGWARDANIYNMNPYGSAPSVIDNNLMIDYIRAWHNTKAVNPTTGFRNPTITNHSYGVNYSLPVSDIISVNYQGTTYNNPSTTELTNFGLLNNGTTVSLMPLSSISYEQDIIDAIADGIIWVGSAGNSSFKIDESGGQDYDNSVTFNYTVGGQTSQLTEFYHRGSTPNQVYSAICVGAIDANVIEEKATFSNCGPRIDVYAPGLNIVSSVHSNGGGVTDSRNSNYRIIKYPGTSMASPNVAGVLACLTEQFPRLTQGEAKAYLGAGNIWASYPLSKQSQITDSGANSYTNNRSLQGSRDNYLLSPRVRKVPNPVGTTYIGGETSSQITFPKEHKFRSVKYDINSSFEGDQQYAVDDDIYASGFIYPRRPIWHRNLT
jgi:plastocyanin